MPLHRIRVRSLTATFRPVRQTGRPNPRGDRMKALTIHQPWAWAIAAGHKPVENRTWTTTYRGQLAIHAGKTWDPDGDDFIPRYVLPPKWWKEPGTLPRGAIVAVAELVDVHQAAVVEPCCLDWGQVPDGYNPLYHWRLANVRALAEPVPCRGALGLWTAPAFEYPAEVSR